MLLAKNFFKFMHGFKSAILAIFQFCQNGTFKPVHEMDFFFAKSIVLKQYENDDKKKFP
jgi:hypothetical protein